MPGNFSRKFEERRRANAAVFSTNGYDIALSDQSACYRTIRSGRGATLYTVGYERRDGEELISALRDAGVTVLADVRQRAMSRKPDFRGAALRARCEAAGIEYRSISDLGSTDNQRDQLRETGDMRAFSNRFRAYARRHKQDAIDTLTEGAKADSVALLCYERSHEYCHRSVLAELVADAIDATVVAIC